MALRDIMAVLRIEKYFAHVHCIAVKREKRG